MLDSTSIDGMDASSLREFLSLSGGDEAWGQRLSAISRQAGYTGRAAQQRHAAELMLHRMADPARLRKAGAPERLLLGFTQELTALARSLPDAPRCRLRRQLRAGLQGEATLIPLFHLARTAARARAQGFDVRFDGLLHGTPWDLTIEREGVSAEIACATVSAEEGRPLQKGAWFQLMDQISPELQTWLAAHPGRYILKVTLPDGAPVGGLHGRISAMLASQKRQDSSGEAMLKLDPLLIAGAQAGLPAALRQQFGHEAHLAVTADNASGSVFVMAARASRSNDIALAVKTRLAEHAARLSGERPGILSTFIEDLDRAEWRALRDSLELEGTARRFLTEAPARSVVAITCASRAELFGVPDAAPNGELRFRNPGHPSAKNAALGPAVESWG
ncbi:hypothetical protein EOD42_04940 [Rhodovarius crocodyli]|uniref:Uncharacterized protein n=1 Tax=Rhodovarius crocodyli TaxID=1979269 RepID=A0A437MP63_9PROT|nr:hypothetical protein [Rhodovarius crocodyli]RVT99438.1 hypothetical protein EOD42_04940 [Rhodovarius crocodyli]